MSNYNSNHSEHHCALPAGHFHHFEPEQAYSSSKLGMWIFIATEIHLFSALFLAFFVMSLFHHQVFIDGSQQLNWVLGAINTVVLLTSSWTMVRAVDSAQHGDNRNTNFWLNWTIFLALCFFVIKAIEYYSKLSHGITISSNVFFGFYYAMTGIHALHVAIGIGLLFWLKKLSKKNLYSETYYTPVEICGLYWHLVDLVWIYLFPIIYLFHGLPKGGH